MRSQLRALLTQAVEKTVKAGELNISELPPLHLEPPKQREFGDLSSNVAMLWAKTAKKAPRAIAEAILKNIDDADGILARQEIAGPGFLNFAFAPKFYFAQLREIAAGKQDKIDIGHGRKVQVEFASVNPTGPLHVGHGRVAVIGDVLARLHEATGFVVEREYYVNDAGNQMENLGLSLYARYLEQLGQPAEFPEGGYPGDYVNDLAAEVKARDGDKYLRADKDSAVTFFRQYGGESLLNTIRGQLGEFSIRFDSYFSEKAMRERGEVAQSMTRLRELGLLYSQDGAEWYRSTQFGDDKDRTVIKSDGGLTYFAADIAYHRNKFERGFRNLPRISGLFSDPVAKGGAEAVHGGLKVHVTQDLEKCHVGKGPTRSLARKHKVSVRKFESLRAFKNVHAGSRQRHYVSLAGLHPLRRDCPSQFRQIDL